MDSSVQQYLQAARAHMFCGDEAIVKRASLGGDGQDAPFEQAFSNLAHAYLRDKAPSLLDHEIGFQLLDRNEENTKAIGTFVFKVGSQTLFAPVFFLQGDLKGHELLYLRNQDMFVPLKENWLNYILNRKPNIMGTGVTRQTHSLGVRQPDLNPIVNSPYKYAAAVQPFLPLVGHLATREMSEAINEFATHCQERLDLGHFMKQASLPALRAAITLMQQKPKIAAAFDKFHGMDVLHEAIKEAKVRLESRSILDDPYRSVNKYHPIQTGSVIDLVEKQASAEGSPKYKQDIEIITYEESMADDDPDGITPEEADQLNQDGVLIKDHRKGEEVSVEVNIQAPQQLTNPPETGIYQVLTKPGEFEKCLVIMDPLSADGRKHFCVVIRLEESTRNWGNFPRDEVWVAGQDEELGGPEKWNDWFDSLPEGSLPEDTTNRFVILSKNRLATCAFRPKKKSGDDSWEVDFSDYCREGRLSRGLNRGLRGIDAAYYDEYDKWRDGARIHFDSKDGTSFRSNMGDLFVPKGAKIFRLQPTEDDKNRAKCKGPSDVPCNVEISCDSDKRSDPPPIQPGKLIDMTVAIMSKTAALRILSRDGRYLINDSEPVEKKAALVHLVKDHGLRIEASRDLLKRAAAKQASNTAVECRIKYANPFLTNSGPSAPSIPEPSMGGWNPMGFNGPTMSDNPQEFVVPELMASNTDPNVYNVNPQNTREPMDANGVMQAAATGQKEVFDTAMIGSMLKAVRDDTMIDRYLPDIIKGIDRLGRIIFMFYWHQDRFAERYGKQDLPELEDSLRNAFETTGDVALFLKQKTIEPYPEEDVKDLDLGPAASI